MIIKKLILHNFGVYAFDNVIELNNEKPVVLVGGLNGRGKTTFLEAVLLALYGSNSFAFTESKYKSYSAYLRAHVNLKDGSKESFVELEFLMNDENDNNTYRVRRSWNLNGKRIIDKVFVYKNGIEDKFLANNWVMFIESVLPSALSGFFFFDGEKIAEIAENDTGKQMKDSIKSLLGINILDTLESDLKKIINRFSKEKKENIDIQKLEIMRSEKESLEEELRNIDVKIDFANEEIEKLKKRLTKKQNSFKEKGGEIANISGELYKEKIEIEIKLGHIENEIVNISYSEMPLLLVKPLLRSISEQVKKEKNNADLKITYKQIDSLLNVYNSQHNFDDNPQLDSFISFIKKKTTDNKVDSIYNFSDSSYIQINSLLNSQLDNKLKEYQNYLKARNKLLNRIDEIENYLSVDIDEKAISRIYKEIKSIEFSLLDKETELNNLEKKRSSINGKYIVAKSEFSKCVEKSLSSIERKDDIERLLKFSILANKVTAEYKIALQKEKIALLADTMTQCYKKILGKKNLIDRITMDPETLDYHYIDKEGNEIQKKSLSAGEKQIMVISMLWALAICSKRKLPVIVDTPIARLDSVHRKALIERYFPYASDQTIILSTDAEIDKSYYDSLKKNVSNEFTLVYDEDNNCTSIVKGYFQEALNDN